VLHPARAREKRRLRKLAESVPYWFHSIDLGAGVVTNGTRSSDNLRQSFAALHLPDLSGKTFLDVGAWDGYFSFEAERLGARRVLALDHYVWERKPRPWDKSLEDLPEKQLGFTVAREALRSRAESRAADFMTMDLAELGSFDVVLFAGVLYHLESPFQALRRLAQVTSELAVIETAAIRVPGHEDVALVEFYEAGELNADPTNWWAPNARALLGMCRAAGFHTAEVVDPPPGDEGSDQELSRPRLVVHARKPAPL
jgi:tRNA (mo5U34)-methyltransferase